ncbi:MAG TPA: hypothetical protein VK788_02690 [Terriglobales bacterium]|nr:hypothetical protein [Terriglobales bacterium]
MRLATLLFGLTVLVPPALAQYGVNWPTQPSTPMATEVEPGTQTLRVSGVNDFLYTYDVNVIEIATPTPPPAFPAGALAGCADAQVNTLSSHAQTAYSAYQKLFPDTATSPKSLLQTQTDWKTNVKPTYDGLPQDISSAQTAVDGMAAGVPKSTCQSAVDVAKQRYQTLQAADTKLNNSSHTVEATFQAKSCKSEVLTVEEKYKGVPTGQSVTVHPTNPDTILITFSGTAGKTTAHPGHVWKCSNMSSATPHCSNISGTALGRLPNIPTNTLVIDAKSPDMVYYVGTDVGIFVTKNSGITWADFGNSLGLPNVQVNHLVLQEKAQYLFAATFGRGIWRIKLPNQSSPAFREMLIQPRVAVQRSQKLNANQGPQANR